MKKLSKKNLLLLIAAIPFFTACDNISLEDRYIEEGTVEVTRNVLLEEFTGQLCTNCPDAHRVIESLEAQYGENLIVVSIHAGKGQFGVPAPYGLMQEEGDEYANRWGVYSYPAGVIDRTGNVLDYNQFADALRNEMGKTTSLELSVEAQLSEDRKKIEVFTTMVSPENMQGSLQLWVIESGIIAMQIDNGTTRMDYVHNNVFRGCVNGLWGQQIPLEANVVKYESNEIAIDELWNLENVSIVGFYYNNSGVIQVEKVKLETSSN